MADFKKLTVDGNTYDVKDAQARSSASSALSTATAAQIAANSKLPIAGTVTGSVASKATALWSTGSTGANSTSELRAGNGLNDSFIQVKDNGDAKVYGSKNVKIESESLDIDVTAAQDLHLRAGGDIQLNSTGNVLINNEIAATIDYVATVLLNYLKKSNTGNVQLDATGNIDLIAGIEASILFGMEDLNHKETNVIVSPDSVIVEYDNVNIFEASSSGAKVNGKTLIVDDTDTVKTSNIQGLAVTAAKLAVNSVTRDKIYAGAVITSKIEDGAVTAPKLSDTLAKIPAPPTTDGTYTLSVTVSDGVPTYTWS